MDFNGGSAMDFATFLNTSLRNNDEGMFGGNGGLLWIFLLLLFNGNNGVFGNKGAGESVEKAVAQARADGLSDQVVIDAVRGNSAAIQQLASTLNCDMNSIKASLCALDKGITLVSGEIGTTGERIINAIQAGNCEIAGKIAECCCNNRIQLMEQTQQITNMMGAGFSQLSSKIDLQTNAMNAGFQGIHDYLCSEKIAGLEHEVTQLRNAANNATQTASIEGFVHNALTPIQEQINQLTNAIPPQAAVKAGAGKQARHAEE